jgi:hypothetical protein
MVKKLADLLRWSKKIDIKDPNSGEVLESYYMRILGDQDIQDAFKIARIKSSEKRAALRNPETEDYKDIVAPLLEADITLCKEIIISARSSNWNAEASSIVIKEDLPKIEDVATDPDAPTLEEQEALDKAELDIAKKYLDDFNAYLKVKETELNAELDAKSLDELRELAQFEVTNVVPLGVFLKEVEDQKVFRSVYEDKLFKIPALDTIEEFQQLAEPIKDQLIEAYNALEIGPDDIKN